MVGTYNNVTFFIYFHEKPVCFMVCFHTWIHALIWYIFICNEWSKIQLSRILLTFTCFAISFVTRITNAKMFPFLKLTFSVLMTMAIRGAITVNCKDRMQYVFLLIRISFYFSLIIIDTCNNNYYRIHRIQAGTSW